MENGFKTVLAVVGAAASYAFGGWSALLGILLAFVVADYVTGVVAAGMEGKLSSSVGMRGIIKKLAIFVLVAVAHLVDMALGKNHMVRDGTMFFYMGNEALSILENTGRMGVPMPAILKQAIEILKGKGEGEKTDV